MVIFSRGAIPHCPPIHATATNCIRPGRPGSIQNFLESGSVRRGGTSGLSALLACNFYGSGQPTPHRSVIPCTLGSWSVFQDLGSTACFFFVGIFTMKLLRFIIVDDRGFLTIIEITQAISLTLIMYSSFIFMASFTERNSFKTAGIGLSQPYIGIVLRRSSKPKIDLPIV